MRFPVWAKYTERPFSAVLKSIRFQLFRICNVCSHFTRSPCVCVCGVCFAKMQNVLVEMQLESVFTEPHMHYPLIHTFIYIYLYIYCTGNWMLGWTYTKYYKGFSESFEKWMSGGRTPQTHKRWRSVDEAYVVTRISKREIANMHLIKAPRKGECAHTNAHTHCTCTHVLAPSSLNINSTETNSIQYLVSAQIVGI